MARFGLIGGFNTEASPVLDCADLGNRYAQVAGSNNSKSAGGLFPRPGLGRFVTAPEQGGRGIITHQATGRVFAAIGKNLYEITLNADGKTGTATQRGALTNDGLPVSMAGSNIQLAIASGRVGSIFTLATNVYTPGPIANWSNPLQVEYDDGFFVSLAGTNQFQYSNALDGLTWQGLNIAALSTIPDNIVGFIWDHRELIIRGEFFSQAYYDSGNVFTFDAVPGGTIHDGLAATLAQCRADNTNFYLGFTEGGDLQLKRLNGYTPVRVSTYAIEHIWRGYMRDAKVSDATMCEIGWDGHIFVQITFPSANNGRGATWWYDVGATPDMAWSRQFFWENGLEWAHKGTFHCVAFGGKHLVLDANSGNIYWMDDQFTTDDGAPIRRIRRCPHIANEGARILLPKIQLDIEPGLASIQGGGSPTQITLQSPNGSLWAVEVLDSGVSFAAPTTVGTPQTILLNDSDNTGTWQLVISNAGILDTQPVTFNSANGVFYQFVSTGGNKIFYLQVTNSAPKGIYVFNDEGSFFRPPQICLRISRDGGKTFGNEHWRSTGKLGEYRTRLLWRQMGEGRDLVFEFTDSDPWASRFIDGWIPPATQRLAEKLRMQA